MEEYGCKKCQRKCQAAGLCECLARAVCPYTGQATLCHDALRGLFSLENMFGILLQNMAGSSGSLAMHFRFQQYLQSVILVTEEVFICETQLLWLYLEENKG